MQINANRLWADLMQTAQFGQVQDIGLTRLSFDQHDQQVRQWFANTCKNLGAIVRTDRIGNQYARFFATDDQQATILIGSHLDTQPNGGRFDGILGVLAGIEVIRTLIEHKYQPNHAIEIINWSNEEGARFSPPMMGSAYACGVLDLRTALSAVDQEGKVLADVSANFRADRDVLCHLNAACYLELHIEQGPVLEEENIDIGIVTSITGVAWFELTFLGCASHAGTTPLKYRDDALIKAAQFIAALQHYLQKQPYDLIATVGKIENNPNTPNTVPANTTLTIDVRSANQNFAAVFEHDMRDLLVHELGFNQHDFELTRISKVEPTVFCADIVAAIEQTVAAIGLTGRRMLSGAGHDALHLARYVPSAMIFTPCEGGISHNIHENITQMVAANGANTLVNTIIKLDTDVYNNIKLNYMLGQYQQSVVR